MSPFALWVRRKIPWWGARKARRDTPWPFCAECARLGRKGVVHDR